MATDQACHTAMTLTETNTLPINQTASYYFNSNDMEIDIETTPAEHLWSPVDLGFPISDQTSLLLTQ